MPGTNQPRVPEGRTPAGDPPDAPVALRCPDCKSSYAEGVLVCPSDGSELVPNELLLPGDPPLEPGTMVGEYRIERKLGAGTFGDVYAGEQPLIGKRVAIKVLNRRFASDPVMVSRFVAEARAVNRIRQRNIIDIFSFGVVPGLDRHYFVMELLDGMTLGELLDRTGRLPVPHALGIIQGIAAGLDAAHEAGITHRDLKPDNVFLARERDGSYLPKLLDFGIAKLAGQEVAHKTSSGMVLGTPRYMSPEQARGKQTDHRADIYALGVMIHEMLTGSLLFDADSAVDLLLKHAAQEPVAMSAVCPVIPAGLDPPVLAMLAKRPGDRPASAGEAVQVLTARARELHLDTAHGTLDDVLANPPSDPRIAPNFSGTTAVVSEPVDAASGLPAKKAADGGLLAGAFEKTHASAPPVLAAGAAGAAGDRRPAERGSTRISGGAVSGRTGPITESVATVETPSESLRKSKLRVASIAVIAVVVSSVALAAMFVRTGGSATPGPSSARDPTPPAASAALDAASATVSIMLWTKPPDVEVWRGDQKLGTTAGPLKVARSSARMELRLRKEGFPDATVVVVPDHDQAVDAELTPPPTAPVASATTKPSAAPARVQQPARAGKLDRILGGRD